MRKHELNGNIRERLIWNNNLNKDKYVFVSYYIETPLDLEECGFLLAQEQSLPLSFSPTLGIKPNVEERIARVVSVEQHTTKNESILPMYFLGEDIDENILENRVYNCGKIELAYPLKLIGKSITQMWNVVFGELPRHGVISAFRMLDIHFPELFLKNFEGPRYGITGLRERLGVKQRPIFCRSTQPPVGITTGMLLDVSRKVLEGGFDLLKDDELTSNDELLLMQERVPAMASLVKEMTQSQGEKKSYFVNAIDLPSQAFDIIDLAEKNLCDGVMASTGLQGIEIIREFRNRTSLPILAHSTGIDALIRHPRHGVHPSVIISIERLCGADLIMLPGATATKWQDLKEVKACLDACIKEMPGINPCMPILAGGKVATKLLEYTELVGSNDYMLVVATAVDNNVSGISDGARLFREAAQYLD